MAGPTGVAGLQASLGFRLSGLSLGDAPIEDASIEKVVFALQWRGSVGPCAAWHSPMSHLAAELKSRA